MKLKVCGMREPDNIREVAKLLPDFMGFIFYNGSKRYVGERFEMPELPSSIVKVGVFVNEAESKVLEVVERYELDMLQLHGEESPELCERLAKKVKVMKAFGVEESFDFSATADYSSCSFFLFDTASKQYGGTGKSYDKSLLEKYKGETPFFISGGIGVEEIKNNTASRAFGWDVNSRFEISPGLKDINLLKKIK